MRLFRRRRPRWTVLTSAPAGPAGEQWGDTWFARDLVASLQSLGQDARVASRKGAHSLEREEDDVVLVLRGLTEVKPRRINRSTTWLLWVISHPELVTEPEAVAYDGVFAASRHWAPGFIAPLPLLQATNPARFNPRAGVPDSGDRVLFVGSTRGVFRPIVRDAIDAGIDLSLYGVGWQEYVAPERIGGEFLANDSLPAAYASAQVVLNDHHPQMAALGFLSNRLFDATATGTRVVSDPALGLTDVFGEHVRTYAGADELAALVRDHDTAFPPLDQRRAFAAHIAREHSFDARAAQLIAHVQQLRGQ
jgi:hypothetical protein